MNGFQGWAGLSPSYAFRHTRLRNTGNKVTTSASFAAVDNTNLPPLSLVLAVGDVVRCTFTGQVGIASGGGPAFDIQVVQPTLGSTRVYSTAASGFTTQTTTSRIPWTVIETFAAAEAGSHTFQPVFAVTGGVAMTIYNSNAATDQDSVILFMVERLGQPAA